MGFPEYAAAREYLGIIGNPVITYILILSLFSGFLSILYLWKQKDKYYDILINGLYIVTGLYILGLIFLIWFHVQIYNTVLIEYSAFMAQMIPVGESRMIIPLWIESEKLYFWAMVSMIFVLTVRQRKELTAFLGIIVKNQTFITYYRGIFQSISWQN